MNLNIIVFGISLSLCLLAQHTTTQIQFGGSDNAKPSRPNNGGRPSRPNNGGLPSRPNNGGRPTRPSFPSSSSVEFGSNNRNNSGSVKSLVDILGESSTEVKSLTRRVNANSRRRGATCTTPLGEAGTCQYIFASQCSSILQIILQQGINPQVLAYLFQAIRSPCGFEGFDFTMCCADPNQPLQSSPAPPTPGPTTAAPTPAPSGDCGVSERNKIVGGSESQPGAWPWAVIVGRQRFSSGFQVMCGGTLLNEDTVLTAAHCFDPIPGGPGPNYVRLGDHDISTSSDGASRVDIRISRAIQHHAWDSNTLDSDIAIVKLSRPVAFTLYCRAACLPDGYHDQDLTSLLASRRPFIIGWGSTSTGGGAQDSLREAQVPMVSQATCASAYSAISRVTIGLDKLCAGDGTRDTCNGDSGGALLSNSLTNTWAVIGVTSFGVDCARPDFPGVYTRVDEYLPWIRQNM